MKRICWSGELVEEGRMIGSDLEGADSEGSGAVYFNYQTTNKW